MVEFGIVALPFFTLVFAIMQLALVFATDQLLETAVADAARMIRTGQAASAGWGLSQFNAKVCGETFYLISNCSDSSAGIQTFVTTSATFASVSISPPVNVTTGKYNASPSYSPAANTGSQIVVVSTYYEYPTLFSSLGLSIADQANGTRLLGAVAAFRTEPF
jgi:Flp pilus assembly protein TadG